MRTIQEIYDELGADFTARSGVELVSGGDMSLRLWAVAAEVYSLEAQAEFVSRQCFPQTASGGYLDMHAGVRGLSRGEAKRAAGKLRFYTDEARASDTAVAAGVRCLSVDESEFVTTGTGLIPAGELWCDVEAEAVNAGARGNAAAGEICYLVLPPVGISGVRNMSGFTGGSDAESDEALRARVLGSYRTLPNGANAAYYEAKVMQLPGVRAVTVQPKKRGLGTVDICFATEAGIPGQDELDAARELLEGEREICVDIAVRAPKPVAVNVSAALELGAGAAFEDVKKRAEAAVRACFGGEMLGRGVYRARLMAAIMGVDGVENCALSAPAADVAISPEQLPELGTLTIKAAV